MRATAGVRSPLLAIFIVVTLLFHGTAGAAQVQQGAIPFQGQMRTYSVYLPDNFGPGRPLPVVMMLHGGEGNGGRIAQQTGLPAFVDRDRFIAVFPDAGGRQWNDGRETTRSEIDDVGFLVAVVHDVVGRYGGDPARVFVGGASNGGMMVQRLACETTSVFNAYAVAIANMPVALLGACHPPRRAPMLFFESTDDPLMPWAGGEIRHGRFRGVGGLVISAPATVDFWSRVDRCGAPRTADLPDRVSDGTHIRRHDFGSCGIVFYEIVGGGHTWPGGTPPGGLIVQLIVGATTHNLDATAVMLEFFRRHGF